jgi:hypothetical protein
MIAPPVEALAETHLELLKGMQMADPCFLGLPAWFVRDRLMRSISWFFLVVCVLSPEAKASERWEVEKAKEWYQAQPWLVGCNFIPSNAINQIEMWQAESFDPETIGRELEWASGLGMNTVRVFLHDAVWREDPDEYYQRIDQFLELCRVHEIRPMLVFFDGVWDPDPQLGPQRPPRQGVHNSGWVQSPGRVILADPAKQDKLRPYVQGVLQRYRMDPRVLAWDLFNEPDNDNANSYGPLELRNKDEAASQLVQKSFEWAREVNPSQPITVCVWGDLSKPSQLSQCTQIALKESDILTFHSYGDRRTVEGIIDQLQRQNRPVLCTEFLARAYGSTWETLLPVFRDCNVGCYCWGLVDGKTGTKYPWHTWQMPAPAEPEPWHHDMLRSDGRPYSEEEVLLIQQATKGPSGR